MTKLEGNPWAVLVVLCLGFFMTLLDTTVVGVAVPDIITRLDTSFTAVLWVSNAYVLVLAALLIPGGKLGDLVGKRSIYLTGVAVFSTASLVCALAPNVGVLIAARALQGVGAALLVPQTMSIIVMVFPAERRGAALGVWSAVAGVATVAGPPLGGLLVGTLGWRWIFAVNIPLGVVVLAIAPMIINREVRPPRGGRFDLRGTLLVTAGLTCLAYGVQEGPRYDWGTIGPFVSVPLVLTVGALLLGCFFLTQRSPGPRSPVMPTALLADRNFALMSASAIGLSVGIMSMAIGFQLYAQAVLGLSALAAGTLSAPMSLISVVLGPYAGRLSDRVGGKPVVLTGLIGFGLGLGLFSVSSGPTSSVVTLLPSIVVMGVGLGLTFAPLTTVAMRDVAPLMAGSAAGVLNASRQIGAVAGTAGFGVLLQNHLAAALPERAETAAVTLPEKLRGPFVDGVSRASGHGLDFANLESGTVIALAPGTPSDLVQQVGDMTREAFTGAFVSAMHVALLFPIAVVFACAASCALLRSRAPVPAPEPATEMGVEAA